ncbi:hypothetical protein BDV33DRAFT_186083 [Aspergillus novoparasiticus]|uniref:Uncharacterized protein n=1 Tax=Aspergillus novoparasiticus TaxID=986946 RepID=A0A5N6E619_9EURO|nr:hypothetical protein BDV33DRAFT_186083 [Aspergillus novoparasiticus]
MDVSQQTSCLGIGLPSCLRELPVSPPVCLANAQDQQVLDIISSLGLRSQRSVIEIQKACCLARGPADLVVLLERPAPSQRYDVDFAEFVEVCPTLNAVDKLIRFATNGARSIHTVSVLDAFLFKPRPTQALPTDSDCLDTLQKSLEIKRPKVVVCCWSGECCNQYISLFRSNGVGKLDIRSQITYKEQKTTIILSFHPATAVCYNKLNANYRVLLAYQFTAAFLELHHPTQPPEWFYSVSEAAANDIKWKGEELSQSDAADTLRSNLFNILGIYRPRQGRRLTRPKTVDVWRDDIDTLVGHLDVTSYANGAMLVARTTLLWRCYFAHHISFQKVLSQLLRIGNRQNAFYCDSSVTEITGLQRSFSLLGICESTREPRGADLEFEKSTLKEIWNKFDEDAFKVQRRKATDLSAHIQKLLQLPDDLIIELKPQLRETIERLLRGYISHLETTVGIVKGLPSCLQGVHGLYCRDEEEELHRSILDRPDSSFILDQIISLSEARLSQERLCSLVVCELASRSQLVGLHLDDTEDHVEDFASLLRETPYKLNILLKSLKEGVNVLFCLRAEFAGAQGLLKYEDPGKHKACT